MKQLLLVTFLGLTTIRSFFGQPYTEFDCHSHQFFGKPCTDCFGDGEMLILPSDSYIARNVQELHMEAFHQSSVAIDSIDMFSRYVNLSVLDIRTGKSFHVDEKFNEPDSKENLREELFNVPNLRTLIIWYEEYNEVNNSWVLPSSLKELHLHHSVFEFNLFPCASLETLIFTNHKLKTIPALRDPPPPLRVLSLSLDDSLDDFTVDDIAPLCQLRRLELVFYASEGDRQRSCECYRLEEWINGLNREAEKNTEMFDFNSDVYLYCPRDSTPDCGNYTLDDAWKKREKCLWNHYGIFPSWLKRNALFTVLMIIVIIILTVSYGVYYFRSESKTKTAVATKSEV